MTRLALALTLLLCGCGITGPGTPFEGTWAGSAQDNVGGPGLFEVTITQTDNTASGTWIIQFTNNSSYNNSGSLSGTTTASSIRAVLTPSQPNACPFNLNATRDGDRLTGTYAAFNCTAAVNGTFDATKR